MANRVDAGVIWTNNLLLLALSLIPFATAYVAQTSLAPFPTFLYGALQFVCGASFSLLLEAIIAARRSEPAFLAVASGLRKKGGLALSAYAVGTVLALVSPTAAMALFVLVAGAYVFPTFSPSGARREGRLLRQRNRRRRGRRRRGRRSAGAARQRQIVGAFLLHGESRS